MIFECAHCGEDRRAGVAYECPARGGGSCRPSLAAVAPLESKALAKLRRDVNALPMQAPGAPVLGYVLAVVAADKGGNPIVIRSIALPDDSDDLASVLHYLREALSRPIDGDE